MMAYLMGLLTGIMIFIFAELLIKYFEWVLFDYNNKIKGDEE